MKNVAPISPSMIRFRSIAQKFKLGSERGLVNMTNFFKTAMKLASSAYQKLSPLTSQLDSLGEAFFTLGQDIIHAFKTTKDSFVAGYKSVISLGKAANNTRKAVYSTGLAAQAAYYKEGQTKTNALKTAGQEISHAKDELVESFKAAVCSLTEILGTAKHSADAAYHAGATMSHAGAATVIMGVEGVKAGAALVNSMNNVVAAAYEYLPSNSNVVNIESAKAATNLVLTTTAESLSQMSQKIPTTGELLFTFNTLKDNISLAATTPAPKPKEIERSYLSERLSTRYSASPAA
jgi:hypothetical protein